MVEVHPFKPTKDSTFTIWYLVSGRGDGLSIKENYKNPNWNGREEIPRMESLQAPLSWRTKSFLILQIEHSRSSSSTSLDQGLYKYLENVFVFLTTSIAITPVSNQDLVWPWSQISIKNEFKDFYGHLYGIGILRVCIATPLSSSLPSG